MRKEGKERVFRGEGEGKEEEGRKVQEMENWKVKWRRQRDRPKANSKCANLRYNEVNVYCQNCNVNNILKNHISHPPKQRN